MNIISELKADHSAMLGALDRIKEAGVTSSRGQEELRRARQMLLAHLQKEDRNFYPAMHRAARSDEQLRRMLDSFACDMDAITTEAVRFFETYANGGKGIEFARDFGRLYATLRRRQEKEERMLYPEFEKLA